MRENRGSCSGAEPRSPLHGRGRSIADPVHGANDREESVMGVLADIQWSQGIQDAWSHVASFVPKLLGFLVILVIGWVVAKAISKILDRVLERVGFDRWVERGGVKTVLAKSKYDASSLLAKVVYYAIMLFVLQLAFGVFGPN